MAELYVGMQTNKSESSHKIDIASSVVTLGPINIYDGTIKTQEIISVVVNDTILVEETDYIIYNNKAMNAGDYFLNIVGIGNYTGIATSAWSIAKAASNASVNLTDVKFLGVGETVTATLTAIGDGEISVSSSDINVATVERNDDIITVTSVGDGNATITVTLNDGTNYAEDSAVIDVNVTVISPTLAENTPEKIQIAAQRDIASALWSVGARTASISIGTIGNMGTTSACAFIIGFDHNSSKEGVGIHFQFGKTTSGGDIAFCDSYNYNKSGSSFSFRMSSNSYNSGGWKSSYMRSTICPAFLTALPIAWQNVITSTNKYTDNTGGGSSSVTCTATSDKIWLLSTYEVFGTIKDYMNHQCVTYSEATYCVQYDYYKNGNSTVKYKHNATSTTCYWWLRSPSLFSSQYFCSVGNSGKSYGYNIADCSYGFAPGFRVGGD